MEENRRLSGWQLFGDPVINHAMREKATNWSLFQQKKDDLEKITNLGIDEHCGEYGVSNLAFDFLRKLA